MPLTQGDIGSSHARLHPGDGLHDGQRQRQGRFAFPLRGLSDQRAAVAPPFGIRALRQAHRPLSAGAFASVVHRRSGRDGTSLCRLSLSPPSWRFVLVHCASSALLNAASTSKPRSKPKPKTTQDAKGETLFSGLPVMLSRTPIRSYGAIGKDDRPLRKIAMQSGF